MIGLCCFMLMSYSRVASGVLIFWGIAPILRNRCGIWGHKVFIHSFIHSFVKCQLGDTPGIYCYLYIVIG